MEEVIRLLGHKPEDEEVRTKLNDLLDKLR